MREAPGVVYGMAGGGSTFIVVFDDVVAEYISVTSQMAFHSSYIGLKYP
jgi:hypothetical protein